MSEPMPEPDEFERWPGELWPGQDRWAVAAARGWTPERANPGPREAWEGEREYHLRHHLYVWCESLRTGMLSADEAIATIRGLCDENSGGGE
jgi:hypothetical protein